MIIIIGSLALNEYLPLWSMIALSIPFFVRDLEVQSLFCRLAYLNVLPGLKAIKKHQISKSTILVIYRQPTWAIHQEALETDSESRIEQST